MARAGHRKAAVGPGQTESGEQRESAEQLKHEQGQLPSVSVAAAFSFLKDMRGVVSWTAADLRRTLNLQKQGAEKILSLLELQGYVHRSGSEEWLTTAAGEIVSGSKPPRFARRAVVEAPTKLSERIAAINKDRDSEVKISEAVAFGDFLSERPKCQAADVGVKLEGKHSEPITDEAKQLNLLKDLGRNRLLVHIRRYEKWMSERTHQQLLGVQ